MHFATERLGFLYGAVGNERLRDCERLLAGRRRNTSVPKHIFLDTERLGGARETGERLGCLVLAGLSLGGWGLGNLEPGGLKVLGTGWEPMGPN